MSVTGIALVLFLTFHMAMNLVAIISADGYNMVCEFLGANWYALAATVGLAALFVIHIIYAFWLTMQNRKARGSERYAVVDKPKTVEWASQNMLVLGLIVIVGLGLHLFNFWAIPPTLYDTGLALTKRYSIKKWIFLGNWRKGCKIWQVFIVYNIRRATESCEKRKGG